MAEDGVLKSVIGLRIERVAELDGVAKFSSWEPINGGNGGGGNELLPSVAILFVHAAAQQPNCSSLPYLYEGSTCNVGGLGSVPPTDSPATMPSSPTSIWSCCCCSWSCLMLIILLNVKNGFAA
ncbi:hypothetical protein niasHT_039022 [Heterodera trifolii]|uniref:Uncharacterized protein n=1 Tax=Heterodera trifolii TaxID=157864 RepID=A0ABD2J1M2_9BILA